MSLNNKTVWSDKAGDLRKNTKNPTISDVQVNEKDIILCIRRLTSGKGRTVIEITGLPVHKQWCKGLAKDLKKALGIGGTYKNSSIELHGEKIEKVMEILDKKLIKWKKTGG